MSGAALIRNLVGNRRPANAPDDGLDLAKIAAMILMAVNHTLIAFPDPLRSWGYLAGRPCLPIFAFVVCVRLAQGPPERATRMLARMLFWGVIAQPVYFALVGTFALRLNILFTLAAGVDLIVLVTRRHYAIAILAAVALVAADRFLDGGAVTPIAQLGAFLLLRRSYAGALALITVAEIADDLMVVPQLWQAALTALGAPVLVWLSLRFRPPWRPLPGVVFYIFYSLHLAVIWLAFGPYR
ncbi:MAG: TraX family protein [Pseudolabrys sp.]